MTKHNLEPLPPDLARLLASEREAAPPADVIERVWSRIAGTLPPTLPRGGGDGGSGSGPGASTAAGPIASKMAAVAVSALLAGGVIGAGLHAALATPPHERIVYVDRPILVPPTLSASSTPPPPLVAAAAPSSTVSHAVRALPSVVASAPAQMDEERALLDDARAALSRGDGPAALVAAERHRQRFANPQLAEEREAIAVQALVLAGRYDEARTRAARFRAQTPNSLFLPAIDASLASIP